MLTLEISRSRRSLWVFDGLHHFRQRGFQVVSLLDELGQGSARILFAVRQDYAGFAWCDGIEPFEQIGLAGMRAEAAQGVNTRLNHNLLPVDSDDFL